MENEYIDKLRELVLAKEKVIEDLEVVIETQRIWIKLLEKTFKIKKGVNRA